ncbi:hypothetical protein HDU98_004622 [Podochytrium sp. JEL0797]|nr:hypothetical protein HDU98_004622 [Podochytrium sp. JEL0797]
MAQFLNQLLATVIPPQQPPQQQYGYAPGPQFFQQVPQAQQQQTLPPGWVSQWSQQYNCYFYANTQTGQTQWTPPVFVQDRGILMQQPPPQQMLQQPLVHGYGRKKALLVGINYTGTPNQLAGCVNDANNLRQFISQYYGYSTDPAHMVVLTDDQQHPGYRPTTQNLLSAFNWLVSGAQPGDTLFFSYSGHGGQTEDLGGERSSGLDDTICPVDFKTAGQIDSTRLHQCLVSALPPGVRITVIMDCCHSGTMMELPYTYRPDANGQMGAVELVKRGLNLALDAQRLLVGGYGLNSMTKAKGLMNEGKTFANMLMGKSDVDQAGYRTESFGQAQYDGPKECYLISGCQDEQTSADSSFSGRPMGALTFALLHVLEQNRQLSFEQMLASLRGFMRGRYSQIPQLSCGVKVDPNALFVL